MLLSDGGNAYGTAPHERLELFEARLYQYPQCDCMRCDFRYPGNFYRIVHGGTGLEGRIRSIADSETYCLKIIQLLLPVNGHGIRPLEKLIYAYNEYVPCVNENWTAYIGIVGAVGFLFLLVWLLQEERTKARLQSA